MPYIAHSGPLFSTLDGINDAITSIEKTLEGYKSNTVHGEEVSCRYANLSNNLI